MFGEIEDGVMRLKDAGIMIQNIWNEIPLHYRDVAIDEFVIMPNHIHGIVILVGAGPFACPDSEQTQGLMPPDKSGQPRGVALTEMSLPDAVHRLKTMTTKRYTDGVKQLHWQTFEGTLWQRNYWEHIIRNEHDLSKIREYIRNNPVRWALDEMFVSS